MSHGGNIRRLREQAGGREIIDFSASLNPLGPPLWLRREMARTLSECEHYPDIDCSDLVAAAADAFAAAPENILPCNGTSEILFALPRVAAGRGFRRALIPAPAYVDYAESCRRAGLETVDLPLSAEQAFALSAAEELAALVRAGDLVFLGLPLNPAGSSASPEYARALAEACPGALVIADAAYYDFLHPADPEAAQSMAQAGWTAAEGSIEDPLFDLADSFTGDEADGESTACPERAWVASMPENVVILWSLTKFYGMAGLRLGLAFARGTWCAGLRDTLPPWNVNTFAQAAGARALRDRAYYDQSRRAGAALYADFFRALQGVPGLAPMPSQANFILCRVDTVVRAPQLAQLLLQRGLAVRTCTDFRGLGEQWLRLAVRSREENARLLTALRDLLSCHCADATAGSGAAPGAVRRKRTPALMLCGTCSNAGKSILTAALCRILLQDGYDVAPFKAQNMALNSFVTRDGLEMGRAQAVQAQAARLEPDVRMNPLLLKPNSDTGSQVILLGKPVGNMRVREYVKYKPQAVAAVREAYDSLAAEHQVILLEGAGSPGEVNLKAHDLVNMRMAQYAQAPVLIVGDIDRGGVYASFIGVHETFAPWERELTKGFLVNRFRGDASLLAGAHRYVEEFTGRPVLGVVPFLKDLGLPQEDSVSFLESFSGQGGKWDQTLDLALLALPHLSNFTDFDALAAEPDVRLRVVRNLAELGEPDLILIPGSKNVPGDLRYLRESGLAEAVLAYAGRVLAGEGKGMVAGVCGGLQMLGRRLSDPHNLEGGGDYDALGLLPVCTTLQAQKTLLRTKAICVPGGLQVHGYEIHHGQSDLEAAAPCFVRPDGTVTGCQLPPLSGGADAPATGRLGPVWGTYLHGVFDDDTFRRYLLDQLREEKGWERVEMVVSSYDLEPSFDRLAATVRTGLDLPALYRIIGL